MFYFLVRRHSASPDSARTYCQTHHAGFATVLDALQQQSLNATLLSGEVSEAWIGGRKISGVWKWMLPNGGQQDLTFTHWGPGEPGSGPDCMAITSAFLWDDRPCSDTKVFVCNN